MLTPISILSTLAIFPALVPNNNTTVQFYGIERELFTAALEPNSQLALSRAQICLQNVTNVNTPFEHGLTALHVAAALGHTELVGKLLEKGANAALKSEQGFLPIHFGAISGNVDLISKLVANRTFAIDTPNDQEQTALYLALKHNQTQAARILVENCANPNIVLSSKKTLLDLASVAGDVNTAKLLIELYGLRGDMPLLYAAENGHLDLVRLLLDNGYLTGYMTPLDAAAQSDLFQEKLALELVQIVQSATNDTEGLQQSYAHYATNSFMYRVIERNYQSVIDFLLNEAHFDVNQRVHSDWHTLLHYCAMAGNLPMMKYLIGHGANVTAVTCHQETVLYFAVEKGHLEMVKLLLRETKDCLNSKDRAIILRAALLKNHTDVVYSLIGAGFDLRSAVEQLRVNIPSYWSTFIRNANLNLTRLVLSDEANLQQYKRNSLESASVSLLDLPVSTCDMSLIRYFLDELRLYVANDTDFYNSALNCGIQTVDYFLTRGAFNLDAKVFGDDILYSTVTRGDTKLVKHLVEHCGQVLVSNSSRMTEGAIMANNIEMLKYLTGMSVPLPPFESRFSEYAKWPEEYPLMTPLMHAASAGNLEMFKYLLNAHAHQNGDGIPMVISNATELLSAAFMNHPVDLDMLKLIVSLTNTTVLAPNSSILYRAILMNRLDLVEYLIDQLHVDYRAIGPGEYLSPLHYAAEENRVPIVKMLIERHRANGWTDLLTNRILKIALPEEIRYVPNFKYDIASYLIFDYRNTSRHNQSIVHSAASVGDLDSLKRMTKYGADLGVLDSMGQTVLHVAARKSYTSYGSRVYEWLKKQTCINVGARDANQ